MFGASIGVWLLLSISDSLLTVKGARMYQKGVKEHFDFSRSIELEPAHQEEIDKFQAVSFRYVLELVLFGGLIGQFAPQSPRSLPRATISGALQQEIIAKRSL
jgi:hypothetical protein